MSNVNLTAGLPETIVPAAQQACTVAIAAASLLDGPERHNALVLVAESFPRVLDVWAALGDNAADTITAYAFYRIGYHRGLDTLRASGWKGSGYVRWSQPTNRAFLRCLDGLGRMATLISELDEVERIDIFCKQLDPTWDRTNVSN